MSIIERLAGKLGFVRRSKRSISSPAVSQMATVNRLTASWGTTSASADSRARGSLEIERARSRQLRDENDYAAKFISMVKTNVLGERGIQFKAGVKDPDRVIGNKLVPGTADVYANKEITEKWNTWGLRENCTVSGTMSWRDVMRVVLEAVATDGEHIIRKVRTPDSPFGFKLKLYEATRLDVNHNELGSASGNEIRMGVEMNQDGKPLFYHLLTNDPSESFYFKAQLYERERVPADEIIHLGIIRRAGQTRFLPWMNTSGYRMNMVGKYEEAEVTAARVAACKTGVITTTSDGEFKGETDANGDTMMDTEPGDFIKLLPGQDVKSVDWQHPSTAYQAFIKTALRGVAAGLNVSYNSLANDMESVNFASGKLGLMEEREVWKSIQAWFIESFCEEVFSAWLFTALSVGAINLPFSKFSKFDAPIFRGRRWPDVNPVQDVEANVRRRNAGLTSTTRLCAEQNIDFEELAQEIANEEAMLEQLGVELPELISKLEIAKVTAQAQQDGDPASDAEDDPEEMDT